MVLISKMVDVQSTPIPMVVETPYDLYTTETVLDETLKEVNILKKIGTFTRESLEREKARLLQLIAEIDERLTAIDDATSETNVFYATKVAEPII